MYIHTHTPKLLDIRVHIRSILTQNNPQMYCVCSLTGSELQKK